MTQHATDPRRIYLPDTNVLVNDPDSIRKLSRGNTVIVPYPVVRELNRLKDHLNGVGAAARQVTNLLDGYQESAEPGGLTTGIPMAEGGLLVFDDNVPSHQDAWDGFDARDNDDRIILLARRWARERPDARVTLVTRDVAMRVKARPLGVVTEDYRDDKRISSVDELYSGTATLTIPDEAAALLTDLYREGWLDAQRVLEAGGQAPLLPNQCCTIRTVPGGKSAYAIYKASDRPGFRLVKPAERPHGDRRVTPVNIEQAFAYELLSDRDISIVTLAGRAGSGKTLMALLAGHDQLRAGYSQLLIYRPNIEIGQSLGFLPGTLEEKFAPWTRPILDNLELIARGASRSSSLVWREERAGKNGRKGDRADKGERADDGKRDEALRPGGEIDDLIQRGLLQIAPISHLRGRSIHDAFIIADEAQNTTRHEVKTLLTRSGEGTKVVLTGDPDQIDLTDVGSVSNGLSQLIEAFKGQPEFGHLTMTTTVRSRLAALAANLL